MTSQPAAAAATAAIQRVAGYPLYAIFGSTHPGAALQRPNLPVVCHQPARHFPADAPLAPRISTLPLLFILFPRSLMDA